MGLTANLLLLKSYTGRPNRQSAVIVAAPLLGKNGMKLPGENCIGMQVIDGSIESLMRPAHWYKAVHNPGNHFCQFPAGGHKRLQIFRTLHDLKSYLSLAMPPLHLSVTMLVLLA